VQSFLVVAYCYRGFIRDFARISDAISELTKKGIPFKWGGGRNQEILFQSLKDAVKSAPVPQLADHMKPYIVTCDASDVGIGAVLEQGSENGPHLVAFASQQISGAEKNYPVHERELLAIVYTLKEWRPYLHGIGSLLKPTTIHCVIWTLRRIFRRGRCDGCRRCRSTIKKPCMCRASSTSLPMHCRGFIHCLRQNSILQRRKRRT
jgi:hypothetical protein